MFGMVSNVIVIVRKWIEASIYRNIVNIVIRVKFGDEHPWAYFGRDLIVWDDCCAPLTGSYFLILRTFDAEYQFKSLYLEIDNHGDVCCYHWKVYCIVSLVRLYHEEEQPKEVKNQMGLATWLFESGKYVIMQQFHRFINIFQDGSKLLASDPWHEAELDGLDVNAAWQREGWNVIRCDKHGLDLKSGTHPTNMNMEKQSLIRNK